MAQTQTRARKPRKSLALSGARQATKTAPAQRTRRSGKARPAIERIEDKVLIHPRTGCHLFQGNTSKNGYATINARNPKTGKYCNQRACRIVAEHKLGRPLRKDVQVRHSCNTKACVNPGHLSAETQADNIADMKRDGIQNGRRKLQAGRADCRHVVPGGVGGRDTHPPRARGRRPPMPTFSTSLTSLQDGRARPPQS